MKDLNNQINQKLDQDFIKNSSNLQVLKSKTGLFCVQQANLWISQASARPMPQKLFGDFWFEDEICILFADTNIGKSILAVQIADSITKRIPTCGMELTSVKQSVIYFDFELSDKQFQLRYCENNNNYIFDKEFYRSEIDIDEELPLKFKTFEDYLYHSLEMIVINSKSKVIIIDNMTYLRNEIENAKSALPLMKQLKSLKKKYNLSILILAHTPKRDLSKPITRNDLSGSKMLMNFCDSSFSIGESTQDSSLRYIKQIKVRNTEQRYSTDNVVVCSIEKTNCFLHFAFEGYSSELEHLSEMNQNSIDELEQSIINIKQGNPNISYRQIGKQLNTNHKRVSRVLKKHNLI